MNKQQYKELTHNIRKMIRGLARLDAPHHKPRSTRAEMHNTALWYDDPTIDKYGNMLFWKYRIVGDYDTGLIFERNNINA